MRMIRLYWILVCVLLSAALGISAEELLVNGDFEIGVPEENKPPSFVAKGWRRQLWRKGQWNAWLTDGENRRYVGKDNQALQYRWGACHIYQVFSAAPGEDYNFSVDFHVSTESRWQARIQVKWFNVSDKPVGRALTVAEADNKKVENREWNKLSGKATAPAGTAYAQVILNVSNRGAGNYWANVYMDNASVTGQAGTHNLPATFISTPNDLNLRPINESKPYKDSLTNYAEDKDGDALTFTMINGPEWLKVEPNGDMTGTPRFADAGDQKLVVKVEDGKGSSDTRTLILPVIGHLRLGNLFDDDMVLQKDVPFAVFGNAVANSKVRVRMSTGESATTTSDREGRWSLRLPALKVSADGPVTMTVISGERELVLKNLLVGDIWFCSGQSNMASPLAGTEGSAKEIASANIPNLRIVRTPETGGTSPWDDLDLRAEWNACSPETAERFSAVAYYFGKDLQKELNIPIGLILSSQGGTSIEVWAKELRKAGSRILYNSRVHPYTRLPIKGAIWYQGEANVGDGSAYTAKMRTLVADWREEWKVGEFPFYFVQLASFDYKGDQVYQLPELWAAQTAAMDTIANTGMAVITDVSDLTNIHPQKKAPVGARLALLARHGTYGETDLVYSGPMLREVKKEKDKVRALFEHVGSGLASRDGHPINGFDLAGPDGAFVAANAEIDGDSVIVSAPAIRNPAWIRFAWHETARSNLMNKEGLPANSFKREI